MNEFFTGSDFFAVALTLVTFFSGEFVPAEMEACHFEPDPVKRSGGVLL